MKHSTRKALRLFLSLTVFILLFSMNAAAASKTVKMKKSGSTLTLATKTTKYEYIYGKFSVPKACTIAVTGNKIGTGGTTYGVGVDLLNSKKKKLEYAYVDAQKDGADGAAIWALNKGTYYLKVSGTMRVAVAASYKAVANKSGATKASAYALTRNKTIRSILASGENKATADWYKFYMPSKVMYMELASAGTASVAYDIYGPSYAKGIYAGYTSSTKSGRKIYSTAGGVKKAVKPGWYYLKVYRLTTSSNSSGVYSVKWYY